MFLPRVSQSWVVASFWHHCLIQRRVDAKSDLIEFTETILFSYEKSLAPIFLCLYVLTRRRAAHVSLASYYVKKKGQRPTSESNSILKCILVIKNFKLIYPEIFCAQKIKLKKMLDQKKSPKRYLVQNKFLSKKFWFKKNFGSKKILGQNPC